METVVDNIRDSSDNEPSGAEQLVGHMLHDDHKLIIQVVAGNGLAAETLLSVNTLRDWCNLYEGLTDAEIADTEHSIVRSDSSRFGD